MHLNSLRRTGHNFLRYIIRRCLGVLTVQRTVIFYCGPELRDAALGWTGDNEDGTWAGSVSFVKDAISDKRFTFRLVYLASKSS